MRTRLAGFILVMILGATSANAACEVRDPYPQGLYASQLLTFVPGYWVKTRGALATGPFYRKPSKLHHTRILNPETRVLGCPKTSLENALTLGHEGYVIVGPVKCFRNGKGPDILIHEPRTEFNTQETFNVYVTDDEKGEGPWYKVASNMAVSHENNFLEIELDGIKNQRGYPLNEFRWIKIEDANSKYVLSNNRYSGFDVSAVKFIHQCAIPIGDLSSAKKLIAALSRD